jgi:tartrate-resistant acid phosphatase type 5
MAKLSIKRGLQEPYIYLVHLSDTRALFAWGKFFFADSEDLLDDSMLSVVDRGRTNAIGEGSEPYGKNVELTVWKVPDGSTRPHEDARRSEPLRFIAERKNYVWAEGLEPGTEYVYAVRVDGVEWAGPETQLYEYSFRSQPKRKPSRPYDNRFVTFPSPETPQRCNFVVIGDFGTSKEIQEDVAKALNRVVAQQNRPGAKVEDRIHFILTTGDNFYKELTGGVRGDVSEPVKKKAPQDTGNDSGEDDDDWFYTYFQPFRHVINQLPVFPSIGNHDSSETAWEGEPGSEPNVSDDRDALFRNLYCVERFSFPQTTEADWSIRPGLFYRFRYGADCEFVCLDTSAEEGVRQKPDAKRGKKGRVFEDFAHQAFIKSALAPPAGGRAPKWKIPFFHHPLYSAAAHGDSEEAQRAFEQKFKQAGVRVCFCGHDHLFMWMSKDSIEYFITGGGGKYRDRLKPGSKGTFRALGGGTEDTGHFLVVSVRDDSMEITPYVQTPAPGVDGPMPTLKLYGDTDRKNEYRNVPIRVTRSP